MKRHIRGRKPKQFAAKKKSSRHWQFNWCLINKISVLGLIACMIAWGYVELTDAQQFPIEKVTVAGNFQQTGNETIQRVVTPYVIRGFFLVNMRAIKDELEQLPWVKRADIHRKWPAELNVHITQHDVLCRWNDRAVFSQEKHLFYPDVNTIPNDVLQLRGPEGMQSKVLETYFSLQALLESQALKIKELVLDQRHAWHIKLTNGIKLSLGQEEITARLARFVQAYPKVFSPAQYQVQYVDLRYKHGMAVQWTKT